VVAWIVLWGVKDVLFGFCGGAVRVVIQGNPSPLIRLVDAGAIAMSMDVQSARLD